MVRGKLTTPKNHQRREVDLSPQLAETRLLREGKELPESVFASNAGTMLDDANVRHIYGRIVAAAGVPYRKFHALRRTFAALLLGSNATLVRVRDVMGHKSIQVTAATYGRVHPRRRPHGRRRARRRATICNPRATGADR